MHLHITKAGGWELPDGSPATRATLVRLGLRPDMPFFLRDDGAYDPLLNAWLRALPSRGGNSPSTWVSYARDIHVFLRFLEWRRHTTDWTTTTTKDLEEFKQVRVDEPTSDVRVSQGTWVRNVAALESLFDWAVETKVMPASPFPYRFRTATNAGDSTHEQAVERQNTMRGHSPRRAPQYLQHHTYRAFRRVGLRGLLPNGNADPGFRGRHAARNALYADLLVSTGVRRGEGGSLLVWEVPTFGGGVPREVTVQLAGDVAKNRDPRPIYIPEEVYRRLLRYIAVQRAHAVARRLDASGQYVAPADAILVTPCEGGRVLVRGTKKPRDLAQFGVLDRQRMVEVRDGRRIGPAQVFVTEQGTAMHKTGWNDVFTAGSDRVKRGAEAGAAGLAAGVAPHDLRHTYAVNFLSRLYQEVARSTGADALRTAGGQLRARMVKDPLRTLQIRLGHRSILSTFVYLQYIEEAEDLAHDAAASWAGDLRLYEE